MACTWKYSGNVNIKYQLSGGANFEISMVAIPRVAKRKLNGS